MSAFARPHAASEEAGLKYFLLGAFASAFLVYGIALVYAATGTTNLSQVFDVESPAAGPPGRCWPSALGLVLVGLGFKVAVVPFHMWTPDVYDGAPSLVTAFMSVGAKAGGFAALLRVFLVGLSRPGHRMGGGRLDHLGPDDDPGQFRRHRPIQHQAHAGLFQHRPRRLHPHGPGGGQFAQRRRCGRSRSAPALFYLLAYALTNLGTWAVVMAVERAEGATAGAVGGLSLSDYAGLAARRPGLALAMAIFMLSLTGLPPTVGFVAKFYVFRATLDAGYLWLALVGVFTSLVSAYYYLRIVINMYMREGEGLALSRPVLNLAVGATAIATFIFGILPGPLMRLATNALMGLAR